MYLSVAEVLHTSLCLGTSCGIVAAWDTQSNECFLHWKADMTEICCLVSKGARLVSGGASKNLRLWTLTAVQEAQLNQKNGKTTLRGLVMESEICLNSEVRPCSARNLIYDVIPNEFPFRLLLLCLMRR